MILFLEFWLFSQFRTGKTGKWESFSVKIDKNEKILDLVE